MKKLMLFLVLIAGMGAVLHAAEDSKPVIKVGVVLPLTGNNSAIGERARNALMMKEAEIAGKTKFDYKFIIEDDGLEFRRTNLAVQKLKSVDKVDVVVTIWGYGTEIAVPLLRDTGILHIGSDRWADKQVKNDYAVGPSVKTQAAHLIALLKELGYKRVVWIGSAEHGSENYRKELERELPRNGLQMIDKAVLSADVRDLRTWIIKTREQKPDAIVQCVVMPLPQVLFKQMKEMQVEIPVVSASSSVLWIDKDLNEGKTFVYNAPATPAWEEKYTDAFKSPADYGAPQFYDTVSMLVAACEKLPGDKKPTVGEVAKSIETLGTYEGATGTLKWNAINRFEAPVAYFLIKDGKAEVVGVQDVVKMYNK